MEAAPSSRAIEAFTDFSDRLVAAEAVSLHKLKRWVDVTSAWTSNLRVIRRVKKCEKKNVETHYPVERARKG